MSDTYESLPPDLPVPVDDGGADHLLGSEVPAAWLPSTLGGRLDLAGVARGLLVGYVYPRTGLPYPLLSDVDLQLARLMKLPTFEVAGMRLYRRLTFVAREGRIEKVFYPVFPPDRNASQVLAWLGR
jgi:Redoxin